MKDDNGEEIITMIASRVFVYDDRCMCVQLLIVNRQPDNGCM